MGFNRLLKSQEWVQLGKFVDAQTKTRTDLIVLIPLKSMDAAFEQEFKKGEIQGMRFLLTIPETMVEVAKQQLEEMRLEEEKQNA